MDQFLTRQRYPFTRAIIEYAPEERGIYGLFDGDELVYVGIGTAAMHIRACLLWHHEGAFGRCTAAATAYTWEITIHPAVRELEVLNAFKQAMRRDPRCHAKIAQQI